MQHARYLDDRSAGSGGLSMFERAAELYRDLGADAGEAEALFWTGTHRWRRSSRTISDPLSCHAIPSADSERTTFMKTRRTTTSPAVAALLALGGCSGAESSWTLDSFKGSLWACFSKGGVRVNLSACDRA